MATFVNSIRPVFSTLISSAGRLHAVKPQSRPASFVRALLWALAAGAA